MRYKSLRLIFLSIACFSFARAQDELPAIRRHLLANASSFGLEPADVEEIEITGSASSQAKNVKHIYIRQLVNGIPVFNGVAAVTLKNGVVENVASRLKSGLHPYNSAPAISAQQAIEILCRERAGTYSGSLLQKERSPKSGLVFENPAVSPKPILAREVYFAQNGRLELCWNVSLAGLSGEHWWSARISRIDGSIIDAGDWVSGCNFGSACENHASGHEHSQNIRFLPPPPGSDQYTVYALPLESPLHGNRSTVIHPSDAVASPYGWHDTDGVAGDEYTITRGNNVYATEDIDDDDLPGYSPDGGAALNFDFAYDSLTGVQGNLDAVITNLFYMNNMMHDIWYHYGFDEASGNFQYTNYTGLGEGFDDVFAQAQDGSGTNNANFGTPPDGMNPAMQMYIWTQSNLEDVLTVNSPPAIAGSYISSTAGFGPPVPQAPLTRDVVLVNDNSGNQTDGCETITNAAALENRIALVRRGNCTFAQKVEACEAAGAVAVIVMNNASGPPIAMGGSSSTGIPSVMISKENGDLIEAQLLTDNVNATLVMPEDLTATDSDFDNVIIAHEYGHGISTRLTGGASSSDCLYNDEQMGEGWSDWFGLMITQKQGDLPGMPRGVGNYVTNQQTNGQGIRPAAYSTDFAVNDYTYAATNNEIISQPHGIGFVWASMLWDLNWALIDQHGFDADIKSGSGGNNMAMSLVIEGLKLQPCSPGFTDGRDAILLADELLYEGQHKCLIWEVFARRGLGYSASQGSSSSRFDQVQAFDTHPSCLGSGVGLLEKSLEMVQVYPNPATDKLTIDMSNYKEVSAIRVTDVQGKVLFASEDITSTVIELDVSAWRSGIYFVTLSDSKGARSVEMMRR